MSGLTESSPGAFDPTGPSRPESQWTATDLEWARKRLQGKQKLRADVVAYAVINVFLIGVWAVAGAGYFWPGWVLAGWGVLLLLDAWNLHDRKPITEDDLDHELRNRH